MSAPAAQHPLRVVVAGGGVAGLEALLALRALAGDRVELTLASPDSQFTYKPMLVAEPFSAGRAERLALAPIARELGARFVQQPVAQVRPDAHSRVRGLDDVYAAGDGTGLPIKQAGLAAQRADAAAEHIATRAGAPVDPQPFRPLLRGELLTGERPLFLHHAIRGGGGDGVASEDCPWWPSRKISARYLAPWLALGDARRDAEPLAR